MERGERLKRYDIAANLPAASIPGRLFNASDTGQRFRDNGTSWNSLDIARGVSTKTASYTALASDNGTLIVMNSSTAKTLTLPSASPGTWWSVAIQNVGAGTLTVSPNGLTIDTSSSNLSLPTGQGCDIYSDGTNYFTMRGQGSAGGGGLTAAPPYLTDGNGNYYVAQTGYKATLPASSPSFLSSATFTPVVGTNGSIVAATSGAVWVKISCSSVIELVQQCVLYGNWASVWAYDGTNIYAFYSGPTSSGWNFQKWTYGTSPGYASNISLATSPGIIAGFVHSRLAYSGGTLSAQVSLDGSTWVTCGTVSSAALTQGGYVINSATAFILSLKGV